MERKATKSEAARLQKTIVEIVEAAENERGGVRSSREQRVRKSTKYLAGYSMREEDECSVPVSGRLKRPQRITRTEGE